MKKIILVGLLIFFPSLALFSDTVSDKLEALDAHMRVKVQHQPKGLWLEPQSPDSSHPGYEKYLLKGISSDKEGIFGMEDVPLIVYIKPSGNLNKDTALAVINRLYAAVAPGGQWPLLCGENLGKEVFAEFISRQQSALQAGKMSEKDFYITEGWSISADSAPAFLFSGVFVGDNKNLKKGKLLKEKDLESARPLERLIKRTPSSSDKKLDKLHGIDWHCFFNPRSIVFY